MILHNNEAYIKYTKTIKYIYRPNGIANIKIMRHYGVATRISITIATRAPTVLWRRASASALSHSTLTKPSLLLS